MKKSGFILALVGGALTLGLAGAASAAPHETPRTRARVVTGPELDRSRTRAPVSSQSAERARFARLDRDRDGSVSQREFLRAQGVAPAPQRARANRRPVRTTPATRRALAAFATLDRNRDGRLSYREVSRGPAKVAPRPAKVAPRPAKVAPRSRRR